MKKKIGVYKMRRKGALIVAILLLSIGFAAVSTTLIINGNAKVSENQDDFSVIFTAASLDNVDVYDEVTDDTKKTITFKSKDLKKLNDTSVLNYEVTNNSSNYDAEVKINCGVKENTESKYTSIKNELEGNVTVVKAKESVNGTLTITLTQTSTEEVTEEYTCTLEFNAVERDTLGTNMLEPVSFSEDSWETIAANVKAGNTSKYNVGDTKEIDLGDLGIHTVRIANKSECTNGETSETACGFVVETTDIIFSNSFNTNESNLGGWKDSKIRNYLNSYIFKYFPTDLQNVISETKVISGHGKSQGETNNETIDKIYLLSTKEIYGEQKNDTIGLETKQLDYYKNFNVSYSEYVKAIKENNSTPSSYWLRSSQSYGEYFITGVGIDGNYSDDSCINQNGISFAFRLEGPSNKSAFATDSWETIAANVKSGNTSKYNVGDTKEVDLGNLGIHTVRIANMSECTTETSETACGFVIEFKNVIVNNNFNNTKTNAGGWPQMSIRKYLNETLLTFLPEDLQSNIMETKVISGHGSRTSESNFKSIDKIYLLSTKEIYGEAKNDTLDSETKQLDYYKEKNVTLNNFNENIKNNMINGRYWLRSAYLSGEYYITNVNQNGEPSGCEATELGGVSPAFRIG